MLTTSLTVGHIEVLALLDGVRDLGGPMSDSFPDVPADELEAFRERMPGVYAATGAWRLHVRAWLVRHPGGVVLVDTGVGQTGAPGPSWFGAPGQLLDALREAGTPPDAVDTVVLTHVHDDHVGGGVVFTDGEPVPAFPRATYLMQRADRRWQAELAREDPEDREIDRLLVQPLERSGKLVLLEGDHEVADGIALRPAPGTPRDTRSCGCARAALERSSPATPSTILCRSRIPIGRRAPTSCRRRRRPRGAPCSRKCCPTPERSWRPRTSPSRSGISAPGPAGWPLGVRSEAAAANICPELPEI